VSFNPVEKFIVSCTGAEGGLLRMSVMQIFEKFEKNARHRM
jgi:hypothetical protein